MGRIYSVITGTGCHIPTQRVDNSSFINHEFYDEEGSRMEGTNDEIISKFEQITHIKERRYVTDDLVTSDIATFAAREALENSEVDSEDLDYIIVAHNFGDVKAGTNTPDFVPSLAARVKNKLGIKNPKTIAYDIPFGCPGWLGGVIQADYFLRSGDAKRALIIGADTLSRISDPHDRDSMIYADGAGAAVLEAVESDEPVGILSHVTRSDAIDNAFLLSMGKSNNPFYKGNGLFLKMKGRKIYEYALNTVPAVIKESLNKAEVVLNDIKKILIHQANAKMDEAIAQRLFRLCGIKGDSEEIMPMTIEKYGNSSVATVPTLLALLMDGKLGKHSIGRNEYMILASVGAGMNINSLIYKMPG